MTFELKGWHVLRCLLAFFGVTIAVNVVFATYAIDDLLGRGRDASPICAASTTTRRSPRARRKRASRLAREIDALRGTATRCRRPCDRRRDGNAEGRLDSSRRHCAGRPTPVSIARSRWTPSGDGHYQRRSSTTLSPGQWDVIARATVRRRRRRSRPAPGGAAMTAATFSQALRHRSGAVRAARAARAPRGSSSQSKACAARAAWRRSNAASRRCRASKTRGSICRRAKLSVRWRDGRTTADAIVARVGELGFEAFPYDPDARDPAGRRRRALPAALPRGRGLCGVERDVPVDLHLGRLRRRDGRGHAHAAALDFGADRRAGGALCRAAVLPFGVCQPCARAGEYGRADQRSRILLALGLSIFETVARRAVRVFRCRRQPAVSAADRALSRSSACGARRARRRCDLVGMQTATATRIGADGRTEPVAAARYRARRPLAARGGRSRAGRWRRSKRAPARPMFRW